ncbi:hypothetical protein ECMP0215613_3159 [Escherichia coli MP021561.3]|nr:hypothetical protein ECMP0215613_3159 [Escherichia coli MP021561.3]
MTGMFRDMEKKLWQLSQYRGRDAIVSEQTYHKMGKVI